jgi:hypothetical protein
LLQPERLWLRSCTLDLGLEALRQAWQNRRFTMPGLEHFARIGRVTGVLRPYLEMLAT